MNNPHNYAKNFKARALACKEAAGRIWKVYMVAAHINHDPQNPNARLVCCCPRCHWRHYRRHGQPAPWIIERMKLRKARYEGVRICYS